MSSECQTSESLGEVIFSVFGERFGAKRAATWDYYGFFWGSFYKIFRFGIGGGNGVKSSEPRTYANSFQTLAHIPVAESC